jgi:hypothetical protein
VPKDGSTIRLWQDMWIDTSLNDKYPQLFSFCKDREITINEACELAEDDIYNHFHFPLSMVASRQSDEFIDTINPLIRHTGNDI